MSFSFLLAGVFAFLLALTSCAKREGGPPLRVGMDLSYPPFEMIDASGKPAGISVEIARQIADSLKRPLEVVPMDFSGLIPALKSGGIDLVVSSLSDTPERRRSISFSKPYTFIGLAMLVRKDSQIHSAADFKAQARVVAVKAGTTAETWVRVHLPDVKRVVFEDLAACAMEVIQGRADAFLYDQISIYHYAQKNADTTRAILESLEDQAFAVGVARERPELLRQVNESLDAFRASGGLQALGDKYLSAEKALFEEQGIPFVLR